MKRSLILGVPFTVIAIATIAAYTGHIPSGWFESPWDKAAHLLLYGWLALALRQALAWKRLALWLPMLLGVIDELTQNLSPHRSPDVWDFAADAAGILISCLV